MALGSKRNAKNSEQTLIVREYRQGEQGVVEETEELQIPIEVMNLLFPAETVNHDMGIDDAFIEEFMSEES